MTNLNPKFGSFHNKSGVGTSFGKHSPIGLGNATSHQGGMAAKMVKCYKLNDHKLLLNTCKLEMKTKKTTAPSVHTLHNTIANTPLGSFSLQNGLKS